MKVTGSGASVEAIQFTVEVEGIIDPRWREWFSGLDVTLIPSMLDPRRTLLIARLPDQAALPSLMTRVTGLNLKVLSVTPGPASDLK